jgi:hypothetical protein
LIFLGLLLFATPAFAFNDSVVKYCAITPQPQHCISSFLTFEQYYFVEYGKFLAAMENDPLAMSQPPAKVDDLVRTFCAAPLLTGTPEHCRSTFATHMPYAIGFMSWHDQLARQSQQGQSQQEQFAQQRELQQRQIDAQLEQARIQANGMALFGAGNALINGMNQGFNNMRLPMSPTPLAVQPYIPLNPVRPPIRCFSSNPGAMQSTTCY